MRHSWHIQASACNANLTRFVLRSQVKGDRLTVVLKAFLKKANSASSLIQFRNVSIKEL